MSRVAIIICTRDHAASLRETLAAIGQCVVPPDIGAELLVVDNGSTDDTAAIVNETRQPNLPLRLVPEFRAGLSRARNAGLRAAADADVVLFTDDDIRPGSGWIEAMCRPILAGQADAVSGRVHFPPEYEELFAREPLRSRSGWFASTADANAENEDRLVGANMAFSRRVVETLGTFEEELGAGASGFHEETLWDLRLRAAGFRLVTAGPESSVAHHFDRSRLTRRHILSIAERMGRSSAWLDYHWAGDADFVSAARWWRARLPLAVLRALTPWRNWWRFPPLWEIQKVEALAYLTGLRKLQSTPRKYSNK